MPYDSLTTRADIQALIPEEVATEIIQNVPAQSAAMSLFRTVRLSKAQQRIPVLSTLPTAYWVSGDTGAKQTTEMAWSNKYLNVEEIAVIVPVAENVIDDLDFDIWGEVRPAVEEAIGRALDAAIFFGDNAPSSWPDDIVTAAVSAGNYYARGTNAPADGGIAEDINQLMALVEADGFDVTGLVTTRAYRARLRGARDSTGQRLLDISQNTFEGVDIRYVMSGLWPSAANDAAELVAGDFTKGILGVRQDITWKLLTEAVIQDNAGRIVYNLAQQDMVAMRVTARFGFQVANPLTREQEVEANRYPFAVLRSPSAGGG